MVHDYFRSIGFANFIDHQLGSRSIYAHFSYSDCILNRIYTAFCGGAATEDINYLRSTFNHLKDLNVPSPDTVLRVEKELSVPNEAITSSSNSEYEINVNDRMNALLMDTAIKYGDVCMDECVYDFDNEFIETEKWDAKKGYKWNKGYFPGVVTIQNQPVYIEGRDGNCHVKTNQTNTHIKALSMLNDRGIFPKYARMDEGSYTKENTDHFHKEGITFYIRARSSEQLLIKSGEVKNWKKVRINEQALEVGSFLVEFGQYEHRIVAYRVEKQNCKQANLFTGDAKKYLFLITNDLDIAEESAIKFYNARGDSERVFDIQNNDFNWNKLPYSFLNENVVYLIIMAIAHLMYKNVVNHFHEYVEGLEKTSRIKRFIFRLICMPAKIIRSGRQTIVRLATDNKELLKIAKST